jgi:3-phenylpropionate/trans-cinnamate dioxygenase ferredoxin reductase subunit
VGNGDKQHCVIVGASHAGTQAALRLRKLGWAGDVTIVGEEPCVPYHRPPLSKDYLKGVKTADAIHLAAEANYQKNNIDLRLGVRADGIDRPQQTLLLDSEDPLHYSHLVLAVGSLPRKLSLPGTDLDGVHYLRNIADVDRIRAGVAEGGRAVVIGGGYIGLEVAASLRILGMDVTVLEALPRVLQRVTCETVSDFFTRVHREESVDVRTDAGVAGLRGEGKVSGVELDSGETIDASLVVVGVGIVPNTSLAEEAGLDIDNGIAVNEYAQTSDPAIYAVGDCTSFYHPRYGRKLRLESVQNANDQAIVAAQAISGTPEPYNTVPWFWSDQYDVKLQIAGLAQGADERIVRGEPGSGRSLSVLYLKDRHLLAVDAMNRPHDFVFGKRLMLEHADLDVARLADPDVPVKDARA